MTAVVVDEVEVLRARVLKLEEQKSALRENFMGEVEGLRTLLRERDAELAVERARGQGREVGGEPGVPRVLRPEAVEEAIGAVCREVNELLVMKNRAYGNSALDPLRCFSRADAVEQLKVRVDDKLSRVMRGESLGEDVVLDLIGYLVLLRVAGRLGTQQ